eukprot:TRINITY_DN11813_c1_g3_i1.p1 TRINITY_DN11813_c1_g3~~TRINITY_DN11813_c1_g3_i1.p1  ORF type:complete len:140 (-),score=41.93 TRINITY_DN11813_c1_g3_i1:906-1325(-)
MSRASGVNLERGKKEIPMHGLKPSKYHRLQEAIDEDHDRFVDDHVEKQQQIMRDQDLALDELGRVVGRLSDMSLAFNVELREQNDLIDELQNDVDQTEGRLAEGLVKVNKFLKDSDKGSLCTILVLLAIVIILGVLVIM